MDTSISTTRPVRRPRRRPFLAAAVVSLLVVGAGVTGVRLSSSVGRASPRPRPNAAATTHVDIPALWRELTAMPTADERNVVAALTPDVRAAPRHRRGPGRRGRAPLSMKAAGRGASIRPHCRCQRGGCADEG